MVMGDHQLASEIRECDERESTSLVEVVEEDEDENVVSKVTSEINQEPNVLLVEEIILSEDKKSEEIVVVARHEDKHVATMKVEEDVVAKVIVNFSEFTEKKMNSDELVIDVAYVCVEAI